MANPTNPPGPTPNPTPTPAPAPQPAPQQQNLARNRSRNEKLIAVGIVLGVVLLLSSLVFNAILSSRAKWLDDQNTDLWKEIKWRRFEETNGNRRATATNTNTLTRVPVVEEEDVGTKTAVSAEKGHKEGVSVNQSTNGVAIKVVADKDSQVRVYVRDQSQTTKSGLLEPDQVISLDPLKDGKLDPNDKISYWITNKISPGETVLYLVPKGWMARAENNYPKRMVQVVADNDLDTEGKIVEGRSMMIRNKTDSITMEIRWQCIKK